MNTLAAGAATAYLVGRVPTPETLRSAALHSYTTAFLRSSAFFVVGAVLAGLVFEKGNLQQLAGLGRPAPPSPGPRARLSLPRPGHATLLTPA